jgi:hypothetical protein
VTALRTIESETFVAQGRREWHGTASFRVKSPRQNAEAAMPARWPVTAAAFGQYWAATKLYKMAWVTAPERGMSEKAVGPEGAPQLSGRFTDRDVGRGGLQH